VDGGEELPKVSKVVTLSSGCVCRKCGHETVAVVLRKTDPYCRSCFEAYVTHKFRSTIGKNRPVPVGTAVLVAVSGGISSLATLRMVHAAVTNPTNKRLRITPHFLHVTHTEGASPDALQRTQLIAAAVTSLGYPLHLLPFSEGVGKHESPLAFSTLPPHSKEFQIPDAPSPDLDNLLASCASLSTRSCLSATLLRALLARACVVLQCGAMFTCHSATHLATELLASIAAGGGSTVADKLAFAEIERCSEVATFKPAMELHEEELLHMLRLSGLPFVEKQVDIRSISGCTRAFLGGLQADFPSTVPTVLKITTKLMPYRRPPDDLTASDRVIIDNGVGDAVMNADLVNGLKIDDTLVNGDTENVLELKNKVSDSSDTLVNGDTENVLELKNEISDSSYIGEVLNSDLKASTPGKSITCALCRYHLDTFQPAASAIRASEISRILSGQQTEGSEEDQIEGIDGDKRTEEQIKEVGDEKSDQDLKTLLCYACRRVAGDMVPRGSLKAVF